jgi:hypothetical protein
MNSMEAPWDRVENRLIEGLTCKDTTLPSWLRAWLSGDDLDVETN